MSAEAQPKHYDFIVVGGGPGGGACAVSLTPWIDCVVGVIDISTRCEPASSGRK